VKRVKNVQRLQSWCGCRASERRRSASRSRTGRETAGERCSAIWARLRRPAGRRIE
jgi:hypothetical protein